jgi:hypothetical protein
MATGCEINRAFVYDRGGQNRLFEVTFPSRIRWERIRDDISQANVTILDPNQGCQDQMLRVAPHRHELVIFRGEERVWEGPITLIGWFQDRIEISAKDVMYYAQKTVMRAGYDNSFPNIQTTIERSVNILTAELARKESLDPPINVLPYLSTITTSTDAETSKVTIPYQSTAFTDIDDMARRSGMDYFVIGRRIVLVDTHTIFSTTPQVTEEDFLAEIVVTQYGSEHATWSASVSAAGNVGISFADGAPLGVDPFYGEWEIVDSAYNEDGTAEPTRDALAQQADRNVNGRNPVPLHVRVPDNSLLNPEGVLGIEHLVPGIRVPLRATLLTLEVSQMQKLDRVAVEEVGGQGEQISITLHPASISDVPPEE